MHRSSQTVWTSDLGTRQVLLVRDRHGILVKPASCSPEELAELAAAIHDCLEYINYEPKRPQEQEP